MKKLYLFLFTTFFLLFFNNTFAWCWMNLTERPVNEYTWKYANIEDWTEMTIEWYMTWVIRWDWCTSDEAYWFDDNWRYAKYWFEENWIYSIPENENRPISYWLFFDEENKVLASSQNRSSLHWALNYSDYRIIEEYSPYLSKYKDVNFYNLWLHIFTDKNLHDKMANIWTLRTFIWHDRDSMVKVEGTEEITSYEVLPVKLTWKIVDVKISSKTSIYDTSKNVEYINLWIDKNGYENNYYFYPNYWFNYDYNNKILCTDLVYNLDEAFVRWEINDEEFEKIFFHLKDTCKMEDYKLDTKVFVANSIEVNWKSLDTIIQDLKERADSVSIVYSNKKMDYEIVADKIIAITSKEMKKWNKENVEIILNVLEKELDKIKDIEEEKNRYWNIHQVYDLVKNDYERQVRTAELTVLRFLMWWYFY